MGVENVKYRLWRVAKVDEYGGDSKYIPGRTFLWTVSRLLTLRYL